MLVNILEKNEIYKYLKISHETCTFDLRWYSLTIMFLTFQHMEKNHLKMPLVTKYINHWNYTLIKSAWQPVSILIVIWRWWGMWPQWQVCNWDFSSCAGVVHTSPGYRIVCFSSQLHIRLCHVKISQGRNIYTMEISESYDRDLFPLFI